VQKKEGEEARGHAGSLLEIQVKMQNRQSTTPIHITRNIEAPTEKILEHAETEGCRRSISADTGFYIT
jgi:hypothetical protein